MTTELQAQQEEPPSKRHRPEGGDGDGNGDMVVVPFRHGEENTAPRTASSSSLSSPTLSLTGHSGSVYALEYSPDQGIALLSASFDKTVLLWSHPDYQNYNVLKGHKNAVLDAHWVDADTVVTCSADKTVMLWDALTGSRLRKYLGHDGIVNACTKLHPTTTTTGSECNLSASVSDDGTARLWDRRQKQSLAVLKGGDDNDDDSTGKNLPILAVAGTEEQLFTGGIDNRITAWDLNMRRKMYTMSGHQDTITSLALNPSINNSGEVTYLLSNSMDSTLKMWDVRPFVADKAKRLVKQFVGHKHNAEKGLLKCAWSSSSSSSANSSGGTAMVSTGSADRMVHIYDEFSTDELYLLPGHKGCVNAVTFHPVENVIASGSSDKQILVGELSS